MSKNYYITTPIYYVNDKPHIGHAYTSLACDISARFKRLDGYKVKFLTGTDEHGQKVEKSARKHNIEPQIFTNQVSLHFRELAKLMNFSNDDFIRTTEIRHQKTAQLFWQKLTNNGYIYKDKYAGWYAVRDEAFYQEDELIDGKAPSGAEVEWMEEESYFFKLSKFQDRLLEFYEQNPDFIAPKTRQNEVISFVRGGKEYQAGALKDLSISRTSFSWGIKVPDDEQHVIYVWLDALTNYLSAIDFSEPEKFNQEQFWPCNLHMVGKDILRFHAVYWPAFLMAANLPLPQKIFAHGWWTNEGEKISKSLGNVINPLELINEFGLDQLRFFLMRQVQFGNDGNFSKEELKRRCNSDLANNFGNLVQRVLTMIQKNCNAAIPPYQIAEKSDQLLLDKAYSLIEKLRKAIDQQDYSNYLAEIIALADKANEYIDNEAPWQLKKTDLERMYSVLYVLAETIRVIAIYLLPVIPDSATQALNFLAVNKQDFSFNKVNSQNALKPMTALPPAAVIFPRLL
ncbi:MAG: methionine--tRNA ligase [Rickettsiales bacterium]